jgi:hypothetical protein
MRQAGYSTGWHIFLSNTFYEADGPTSGDEGKH